MFHETRVPSATTSIGVTNLRLHSALTMTQPTGRQTHFQKTQLSARQSAEKTLGTKGLTTVLM